MTAEEERAAVVAWLRDIVAQFTDASADPVVIFDRNMAAGYIESVRHLVMPSVLEAAGVLVDAVKPEVIYRATYSTQPPEKSLSKHQMITDMIVSSGYEVVQTGTDQHRRAYWVMTKCKEQGDE